jgi:hypothetical protein
MYDGTNWNDVGSAMTFTDPLPVTSTVADYTYYGNTAVYGNSAVYGSLDAPTPGNNLGGRLISNILTTAPDNFAGNNNDLAAGNVHEADYSGSFTGLTEAGLYRISVSGIVKDNSGTGSQNFSVTSGNLIIGGCEGCTPACNPQQPKKEKFTERFPPNGSATSSAEEVKILPALSLWFAVVKTLKPWSVTSDWRAHGVTGRRGSERIGERMPLACPFRPLAERLPKLCKFGVDYSADRAFRVQGFRPVAENSAPAACAPQNCAYAGSSAFWMSLRSPDGEALILSA